jgi:hypothetical protein
MLKHHFKGHERRLDDQYGGNPEHKESDHSRCGPEQQPNAEGAPTNNPQQCKKSGDRGQQSRRNEKIVFQ